MVLERGPPGRGRAVRTPVLRTRSTKLREDKKRGQLVHVTILVSRASISAVAAMDLAAIRWSYTDGTRGVRDYATT